MGASRSESGNLLNIIDTTFIANRAAQSDGMGGGVFSEVLTALFSGIVCQGNAATVGGCIATVYPTGHATNGGMSITLQRSSFSLNAAASGLGIYARCPQGGSITLTENLFNADNTLSDALSPDNTGAVVMLATMFGTVRFERNTIFGSALGGIAVRSAYSSYVSSAEVPSLARPGTWTFNGNILRSCSSASNADSLRISHGIELNLVQEAIGGESTRVRSKWLTLRRGPLDVISEEECFGHCATNRFLQHHDF